MPSAVLCAQFAVSMASPPQTPLPEPLYSFDLMSPAVVDGFVEADDVLTLGDPFSVAVIRGAAMGLGASGDELDDLSGMNALISPDAPFILLFSVSRDTQGTAQPDPALVALGIPYNVADQAARGHQAGDEFMSTILFTRASGASSPSGNNTLGRNNFDEGGNDLAAQPETSAHSDSVGAPQDNVDALADLTAVSGPYFSAGRFSPSLASLPGSTFPSGAHIFHYKLVATTLYASFGELGLQQDDDIDALVVFDTNMDGVFNAADQVLFSLTPDSPSLITIPGASATGAAADVFSVGPGGAPQLFAPASSLGLGAALDDIDALEILLCGDPFQCVTEHGIRKLLGDFDGDGDVDPDDLNLFDDCFRGDGVPYPPGCSPGDFDQDGDIDCTDRSHFGIIWSESAELPPRFECSVAVPALTFPLLMVTAVLMAVAGIGLFRRRSETG